MPQAHPEDGNLAEQRLDGGDGSGERFRVARAVGEKDAGRFMSKNGFSVGPGRNHLHLEAP